MEIIQVVFSPQSSIGNNISQNEPIITNDTKTNIGNNTIVAKNKPENSGGYITGKYERNAKLGLLFLFNIRW